MVGNGIAVEIRVDAGGSTAENLSVNLPKVTAAITMDLNTMKELQRQAAAFTDIADHWAKDDIAFAAARGLLTGMGNNQFSPGNQSSIPYGKKALFVV